MPVKEMQIMNGTELLSVQCIECLYTYMLALRMKRKNFSLSTFVTDIHLEKERIYAVRKPHTLSNRLCTLTYALLHAFIIVFQTYSFLPDKISGQITAISFSFVCIFTLFSFGQHSFALPL